MIVVVARDVGRWPLRHGQDPVDLLAENGWTGHPLRAVLGEKADVGLHHVELHYAVTRLPAPAPPPSPGPSGGRPHQRLAAYAIVVDEGRLLMAQLSAQVGQAAGRWGLPGGGVDPGEEPLHGVVREVHEETGQHAVVEDLVQVQSMHWVDDDEDFHAVRLIYRAHCPSPTAAHVVEVDGSTGRAAWVRLGEVAGLPLVGLMDAAWPFVPDSESYPL